MLTRARDATCEARNLSLRQPVESRVDPSRVWDRLERGHHTSSTVVRNDPMICSTSSTNRAVTVEGNRAVIV